jgi:restriction system protein
MAREAERAQRARIREIERQRREDEREARRTAIANRIAFFANKESETAARNKQLEQQISDFQNILASRIGFKPLAEFNKLFRQPDEKVLDANPALKIPNPPRPQDFLIAKPNILIRWLPGVMKRYSSRVSQAKTCFDQENSKIEKIVQQRSSALAALKAEVDAYNKSIVELARNYVSGEPTGVADYFEFVMQLSGYPEPVSLEPKVAYVKESKQLVVEIELPTIAEAVPAAEKYRYVKKTNEIVETPRSDKSKNALYIDLISQIVLRCLYELCIADTHQVAETSVLNAFVSTLDPATGHKIRPCLISVRISRDAFLDFDLRNVEPTACLKQLRASVSSQPGELIAVKPILDLNMVDPRFIKEENVLSTLDQRPNLMDLSPKEFESLITNLFSGMGLETRQTQASRDGGVDCVAFDSRPILGGKVIIQAKRYKNTVGVAAVRDLFGTLHNEGASKGILVTTSGFGKSSYEFANGKPIELITGSNLLYLLKESAGVDAKIEAPPDWVDPRLEIE